MQSVVQATSSGTHTNRLLFFFEGQTLAVKAMRDLLVLVVMGSEDQVLNRAPES